MAQIYSFMILEMQMTSLMWQKHMIPRWACGNTHVSIMHLSFIHQYWKIYSLVSRFFLVGQVDGFWIPVRFAFRV